MIIDADTEFDAKLRALRDAAGVGAEEAKQYEFVLTNALDTIDGSTSATGTPWSRACATVTTLPHAKSSECPISAAAAAEPQAQ